MFRPRSGGAVARAAPESCHRGFDLSQRARTFSFSPSLDSRSTSRLPQSPRGSWSPQRPWNSHRDSRSWLLPDSHSIPGPEGSPLFVPHSGRAPSPRGHLHTIALSPLSCPRQTPSGNTAGRAGTAHRGSDEEGSHRYGKSSQPSSHPVQAFQR